MSVRRVQIFTWLFDFVGFIFYVFATPLLGAHHSLLSGIIFVIIIWIVGGYNTRQTNKLLDQMWAKADALGLSATDLSRATKYQGSIDLALTRPENRRYFISKRDIKRINQMLDEFATSTHRQV